MDALPQSYLRPSVSVPSWWAGRHPCRTGSRPAPPASPRRAGAAHLPAQADAGLWTITEFIPGRVA
jgi:hypothetical protein